MENEYGKSNNGEEPVPTEGTIHLGRDHEPSDEGGGTPGTVVLQQHEPSTGQAKVFNTIHVSSSSKARALIQVCSKCQHDNLPEALFCERCGEDLTAQQRVQDEDESRRQIAEYTERVASSKPKKDGRTLLRRRRNTPIMQQPQDVEKKSYQSQYIPPGAQVGQYEPAAFRSEQQVYPSQPVMAAPQYQPLSVNYGVQPAPHQKQTAFVVGIVVASVLAVLLISLVVVILVLAF